MNKILYFLGAVVIIGVIIFIVRGTDTAPSPETEGTTSVVSGAPLPNPDQTLETAPREIAYTNDGFLPRSLAVPAGSFVSFTNDSSRGVWIASDPHPVHTGYPGTDIKNCGSGTALFDTCRVLNPGESWTFVFAAAGAWGFHNHLQATETGTIIVE